MSGVQCVECGRVGPVSHMHTEYTACFGDRIDPGDPEWVHNTGRGCKKQTVAPSLPDGGARGNQKL